MSDSQIKILMLSLSFNCHWKNSTRARNSVIWLAEASHTHQALVYSSFACVLHIIKRFSCFSQLLIMMIIRRMVFNSYLAKCVVILVWRISRVFEYKTVGYGEVVNLQISKCHPILLRKKNNINECSVALSSLFGIYFLGIKGGPG